MPDGIGDAFAACRLSEKSGAAALARIRSRPNAREPSNTVTFVRETHCVRQSLTYSVDSLGDIMVGSINGGAVVDGWSAYLGRLGVRAS